VPGAARRRYNIGLGYRAWLLGKESAVHWSLLAAGLWVLAAWRLADWPVILLAALAVAAAYYLLLPLLVLAKQRMRADAELLPFDPATAPMPPPLPQFFQNADAALTGLGFRRLGSYGLPDPLPNVQAVLHLYVHEPQRDAALVSSIYGVAADGSTAVRTHYVEFFSRFSGGDVRAIQTNNSSELGSFPARPHNLTFRFPQVQDLGRLYRLHRALVGRHAPGAQKVLRVLEQYRGDASLYLREAVLRESYQEQETTGYLRYDAAQACWRPTVKGAYLMAWRELWPIKPLRRARVRAKALRLERELL